MLQSSAYRTKPCPRRSNSRSSSSSTRLLNSGESGPPCGVPLYARTNQPVFHHPGIQECPDEFQQPLVRDSFGDLAHQFVVIHSIKKFLQIKIHTPVVVRRNILLRLCHCLLSRPPRPEPITAFGKRSIPSALQNLHHRLLNESIQHRRDAKLSHPFSVRLGDFHPPHRLRCISSAQQLFPDGWPMLFQAVADFIDAHAIDSRATLIRLHPPQCFLQIFSLTYFLHQSIRIGWAFGVMSRQTRFSLFPPRFAGFTRWRGREVQFKLDILLLVAPEIHVVLAAPLVRAFSHRSRLGLSVDSAFRHWSASIASPTT